MNDLFHKEYKDISVETVELIKRVKEKAEELYALIGSRPESRESSLAKTKLEEAVMWFVKGLCK